MFFKIRSYLVNVESKQIRNRLFSPISKREFFSLLFLLGLILVFSYHHHKGFYHPHDYRYSYMPAGSGDFSNFFYSYWVVPVLFVLEKIPFSVSYIIWSILNVLGAFFASRVFGGKAWLAILNYQMIYVVFYGQITGILLGGLALAWWGIKSNKYYLAGLGFLIAAIKPQFGLALGLIFWLLADITWRERLTILIIPIIGVGLTFVIYPNWIYNIINAIQTTDIPRMGDITLWRYIGPWSMLLLIPPFILGFSRNKRILLSIVTLMMVMPYFQQSGLLALYALPFGWMSLLGNLGFLFPFFGWDVLRWLFVIPLSIYIVFIFNKVKGILDH